ERLARDDVEADVLDGPDVTDLLLEDATAGDREVLLHLADAQQRVVAAQDVAGAGLVDDGHCSSSCFDGSAWTGVVVGAACSVCAGAGRVAVAVRVAPSPSPSAPPPSTLPPRALRRSTAISVRCAGSRWQRTEWSGATGSRAGRSV